MRKRLIVLTMALMVFASPAFAYTRDWNNASPVDHTLNKNWPSEDRKVRVDVEERLDDIMDGFTSGDTVTRFNRVPHYVQAADETGVANTIILYGKDVSAKTELFAVDEDDNVVQITNAGKLSFASISAVADMTQLMELVYPVGSVVTLGVSTNPATLFGVGTWTQIEGKVIVGISDEVGDAAFDTLNETGGAQTHTLTLSELPANVLEITDWAQIGLAGAQRYVGNSAASGGSGAAHNNLQPYIVKYVWERTL